MYKCVSTECPKYHDCAVAHRESDKVVFLATMYDHDPLYCQDKYMCGPRGNYAMYRPLSRTDTFSVNISQIARECAVCESLEYEGANIVNSEFWICEDCLCIFKQIITERKKAKDVNNYVMKHHD